MGKFSADEHFGTHLDAPARGRLWTTDQIPVDRLVRPGVCVNVEAAVKDETTVSPSTTSFASRRGRPDPRGFRGPGRYRLGSALAGSGPIHE
jgi:hypothetical protein